MYPDILRPRQPMPPAPSEAAPVGAHSRTDQATRYAGKALNGICWASLALLPLAGGARMAAAIPGHVEFSPGLSAEASLRMDDAASINTGMPATLSIPNANAHLPLIGHVSANVRMNTVDLPDNKDAVTQLYGIGTTNLESTFVKPVEMAIAKHAALGLAGGFLLDGTAAGGLVYLKRRKRRAGEVHAESQASAEDVVQAAEATGDPDMIATANKNLEHVISTAPKVKHEKSGRKARWLGVAALGAMALNGCAYNVIPMQDMFSSTPANAVPLNPAVTKHVPFLKNTIVIGNGGKLFNSGAQTVDSQKEKIDKVWTKAEKNLEKEAESFAAKGGMNYLNDPDIVVIQHESDIHGNWAALHYLRTVARIMKPDIIADEGDTYTNCNTTLTEKGFLPKLLEQYSPEKQGGRKIVMVKVSGNHDPTSYGNLTQLTRKDFTGTKFKQFISLDKHNHYNAEVDGAYFVGAPDPTRTVNGTLPSDPNAQQALIAKQGEIIAAAAAKAYDKTGIRPFALGHEFNMVIRSILNGDVQDADVGHTHIETPQVAYQTAGGSIVYQRTIGSSSGVAHNDTGDFNLTAYSAPKADVTTPLTLYRRSTHQDVGMIDVITTKAGKAIIRAVPLPTSAISVEQDSAIQAFLASPSDTTDGQRAGNFISPMPMGAGSR